MKNLYPKHELVSRTHYNKSLVMASTFGSKSKFFMTMSIPSQDEPLTDPPVQGKEEDEMETDMEVEEVTKVEKESKFETDEEVEEILEEEEEDKDDENFNSFPTIKKLSHLEWLLKNP
nr:hypothetical protein [Tanacetum cinerariifolium]